MKAYLTGNVKKTLLNSKIAISKTVIKPGGCTKYLQAPDVVWNRPFQERIQDRYDDWLADAKHECAAARNTKPVSSRLVVKWIIKQWEES